MIGSIAPATHLVAVTPDDSTQYLGTDHFRGFIPDTTGTVTVDALTLGTNIAVPVIAGALYPIQITRIYATGTDSTTVIGLR